LEMYHTIKRLLSKKLELWGGYIIEQLLSHLLIVQTRSLIMPKGESPPIAHYYMFTSSICHFGWRENVI
jgi:hypothetical protein